MPGNALRMRLMTLISDGQQIPAAKISVVVLFSSKGTFNNTRHLQKIKAMSGSRNKPPVPVL